MTKIYKKLILSVLIFFPLIANAHVQHYENLNEIEFAIYRNNKHIGKHVFSFERSENQLNVVSKIDFQIKKLGVVLYKYSAEGEEIFKNYKLVEFNSKTNQNGKEKYVNLKLKDEEFVIDGSSFKGTTSINYMLGTWWNHEIVRAKAQISAVSGRIIHQKVTFLGKETIEINGKKYNTLHFNFSSTDAKLSKDKKLNTNVWYDENTLNWVKATFNKKGKWEYRLVRIK